jgi:hypothetical protein
MIGRGGGNLSKEPIYGNAELTPVHGDSEQMRTGRHSKFRRRKKRLRAASSEKEIARGVRIELGGRL